MPKKTTDALLQEANARLKAANIRVRIATRAESDRLYLRATLPPKPNSIQSKAYQQRIALGVYFNPAGIKRAEAEAQKLNHDLMLGQFTWSIWLNSGQKTKTVVQWICEFEKDYFTRRERTPKTETTWDNDYRKPYRKLPQENALTAKLLLATAESYAPDTKSRMRACAAYTALAKFANIEVNLKPLRGNYRPTAISRDRVPDDALILDWEAKISNPAWQRFYQLCACYGLRNHEAFYIDLERQSADPLAVVKDGKTGYRHALPCPLEWWEKWFKGQIIELPQLKVRRNHDYGIRSAQYFGRQNMPFTIYDLRHAHAWRMELRGIGGTIAARSQGHSLKVHSNIYLNFMGESEMRQVLEQLR